MSIKSVFFLNRIAIFAQVTISAAQCNTRSALYPRIRAGQGLVIKLERKLNET